jgi:predicted Rossmann-fold nucleotide-binding protein
MMRVLVCGGRAFEDRQALNETLSRLREERGFSLVIAGGARGADTFAKEWAKAVGLPCDVYKADWEGLGRKAGPIRNQRMLDEGKPDLVVAFPGGKGTADMARRARAAGIELMEVL